MDPPPEFPRITIHGGGSKHYAQVIAALTAAGIPFRGVTQGDQDQQALLAILIQSTDGPFGHFAAWVRPLRAAVPFRELSKQPPVIVRAAGRTFWVAGDVDAALDALPDYADRAHGMFHTFINGKWQPRGPRRPDDDNNSGAGDRAPLPSGGPWDYLSAAADPPPDDPTNE